MAYTLALLGANVAVVLLGAHWVRDGLLRSRPVATTLLALWCVSLLGLTVFLKDPAGSSATRYEPAEPKSAQASRKRTKSTTSSSTMSG